MSNGRQTKILFLDGTEINVHVQPSLSSRDLLDMVFSHLHIKTDKPYFGIFWKDSGNQNHWLDLERNVLDQELPPNRSLLLFFGVRFFCESFTCLSEDSSVLALFYQIVRNLHSKELCFAKGPLLYETYAHILKALHGDYKEGIEHEVPDDLVDVVIEQWRGLTECSRGKAVVLTIQNAENSPSYGMHYFQVKDKQNNLHWLGVSHKGIGQFDYENKTIVTKMFTWKQLENLYYRDKKFSIEVHDSKRMVQSKSTFNIYEETRMPERYHGHIHSSCDELSTAINEPTTQVSTSRRTFSSGSVNVHAWFTNSLSLTKNIWQTAIEQHKHYLRPENFQGFATRTNEEIVKSLDRAKFVAVGKYTEAIMNIETLTPEERKERKVELEKRKLMLEEKLKKKLEELKASCLEEYQLTGRLPKEYPMTKGEPEPKLVGTSFQFSPKLLSDHADIVEHEIVKKVEIVKAVVAANKRVYKESKGTVRRKHKLTYKTSTIELGKLEKRLNDLKIKKGQSPVAISKSIEDISDDDSLDDLNSPHDSPGLGSRGTVIKSSSRSSSPEQVVVTYARYPSIRSNKQPETPRVEYIELTPSYKAKRNGSSSTPSSSPGMTPSTSFNSPPHVQSHNLPSPTESPPPPNIYPEKNAGYKPYLPSHRPSYRVKQYPTISQRYIEHVVEPPQYPIRVEHSYRPQHAALQQIEANGSYTEPKQLNMEYESNRVCSSTYTDHVLVKKFRDCVEVSKPFLSSDVVKYSESRRRQMSPLSPDNVQKVHQYAPPELLKCEPVRSPTNSFEKTFGELDISCQSDAFKSEMMNWLTDRNQQTPDSTLV